MAIVMRIVPLPPFMRRRLNWETIMLTRRAFLTAAGSAATLLAMAGLSGCDADDTASAGAGTDAAAGSSSASATAAAEAQGSDTASAEPSTGEASAAATGAPSTTGGILVAYFSATGRTQAIAEAIAAHAGADLFAITPAQPYTDADLNYNDASSRASTEHASDTRPELAQMTPDAWGSYATVFVGYPIWWDEAGFPAKTFVAGNDFTGKTVVPFCTSASSSIGSSADELAGLAGTGAWRTGQRFSGNTPTADVEAWVDGLGL